MKWSPLAAATGVGLVDGLLDTPASGKVFSYDHLALGVAVLGAGYFAERSGRYDPNLNYGAMTAAAALLFSRLPAALSSKGLHAYGEVAAEVPRLRVLPSGGGGSGLALPASSGDGGQRAGSVG